MLLRRVRLVPVEPGADEPGADAGPVDLRVRGGSVVEVAPSLEREPGEELVEADGRWLVPGLWDAHVHMGQWALDAGRLDLGRASSPEEAVALVASHVAATPGSSAVVGSGHRSGTWTRVPTVAELDAVAPDRPVVLVSGDCHHGWLNSTALRMLGVPPREGPLDENEWFAVYGRLDELPGGGPEQAHAAYRSAVDRAAARGVVGIVDVEMTRGHVEWPERVARGLAPLRVRVGVYPDHLDEVLTAGLRTGQELAGGAGLVTMGPLKVISDGSLNTRTAYCCEPYGGAGETSATRGRQNYTDAELVELLDRAHRHGLEAAVHAIGDAAAGVALDAFAATGARGSVEHAQLLLREDVHRMARLGIRASVQPAHLLDDRDVTTALWPDRMDRCFLFRSMLEAGVALTLGSDAPVSRLDPWLSMAAAVHRSADQRAPWNGEEALTAAEALAASTDGRGTPTPGAPADLVLLDADPLAPLADSREVADHLRTMTVALTMVAGAVSHRAL